MVSLNSYVLAVLTLLSLRIGFGNSMPIDNSSIANSLLVLSKTCSNPLFAAQIIDKIVSCNVATSNTHNKQDKLDCLLFYDINKQLCQAAKDSNFVVNEDAILKMNASRNIDEVCKAALTWNISNLEEYPHYKSVMDQLLKRSATCGIVCKSDDIESLEANFYCKYYSWGVELLKSTVIIPKPEEVADNAAEVVDPVTSAVSSKNMTASVIQPSTNTANQITLGQHLPEPKPQTLGKIDTVERNLVKPVQISKIDQEGVGDNNNNDIKVKTEAVTALKPPLVPAVENPDPGTQIVEKPEIDENVPLNGNDINNNVNDNNNGNGNGFGDGQGNRASYNDDDTEYNNLEGFEQPNAVPPSPKKKPIVESGLSFNGDILPQKEMVTRTFPEGFSEENDNFFPVFVTGIIMVVLLYVLYHNKSRVSKVVLGLIVEGRQSNRRRNSRGHAYRRLDTLEQAMNTNQSAAPSKIIY